MYTMKVLGVFLLGLLHFSSADVSNKRFPLNFTFGVATAAYQVEGGWDADGKGPSIWDTITHKEPNLFGNATADVAADCYNHYEEDVKLLKELGVTHYRFSIAWSRILPTGLSDNINDLGIQFYKTFIQLLRENDIEPLVTMYHWDLPQALQDHGGFLNSTLDEWFEDYARVLYDNFGEQVKYWITFNEPIYACIGYAYPVMAPGVVSPAEGQYVCGHNLLRAHARAWHLYDEEYREKQGGLVSLVSTSSWTIPLTDSEEDIAAADTYLQFYLGYFSDPCYFGDYPEVMKARVSLRSSIEGYFLSRLPEFTDEEKVALKGTCDFYTLNNYNSVKINAIPEPNVTDSSSLETDMGVGIGESAVTGREEILAMLKYIQERYNDPYIVITENGLSKTDRALEDDDRIEAVQNFLSGIRDAIDENVQVVGYTLWSFVDTFEWAVAYTVNFGLYAVDFESDDRPRTPRKSATWYKGVIQSKCLVDECVD